MDVCRKEPILVICADSVIAKTLTRPLQRYFNRKKSCKNYLKLYSNRKIISNTFNLKLTICFQERFSSRSKRIGPKVHQNRRIQMKWGAQYHKAIQDVVFGKQCIPYMPTEPPASLSEEIVESGPLYVCKQCKDW